MAKPDDNILELVGRVASNWATLEFQMDQLIWSLTEVEQMLGACVTSSIMTTSARIRAIIALLTLRQSPKEFIKRLDKFNGHSTPVREERNRIVHSPWGIGEHTKAHYQLRIGVTGKKLAFEIAPADPVLVKQTIEKINKLNDDFNAICIDILAWLPSSGEKWRTQLRQIVRPKAAQDPTDGT